MPNRITFVTIGQTPRSDLVPELVGALPDAVEVVELGALDGLDERAIAGLAPGPEEAALVTRLRDGRQAVVGKPGIARRLRRILESEAPEATATVLLCTGDFPDLDGPGLFLDAQHIVDHGIAALGGAARSVGLLVPLERQQESHHLRLRAGKMLRTAHASPYEDADFAAAGRALADCGLIAMHCMGYTEAQREAVAEGSGRPVLLARRLVAAALTQVF